MTNSLDNQLKVSAAACSAASRGDLFGISILLGEDVAVVW